MKLLLIFTIFILSACQTNETVKDPNLVRTNSYEDILKEVRDFKKVKNVSEETYRQLIIENPELFYMHYVDNNIEIVMEKAEYEDKIKEIEKTVKSLVVKGDDVETLRRVHDYIVLSTTPTNDTYDFITDYNAFVDPRSNCYGYANAFKLASDILGYDVITVTKQGNDEHSWNVVTLDDKKYVVDATWDDPLYFDSSFEGFVRYSYFMVETPVRTHNADERFRNIETTDLNYVKTYSKITKEDVRYIASEIDKLADGSKTYTIKFDDINQLYAHDNQGLLDQINLLTNKYDVTTTLNDRRHNELYLLIVNPY